MQALVWLLIRGLACWRLSYMLVNEDGPGRVFRRVRQKSGIEYFSDTDTIINYNDYTPLTCIYCTSLYSAAALLLLPQAISTWLALSGIAILIEKCSTDGKS